MNSYGIAPSGTEISALEISAKVLIFSGDLKILDGLIIVIIVPSLQPSFFTVNSVTIIQRKMFLFFFNI